MYIKRAFKPCRNYRNYVIQLVKSAHVLVEPIITACKMGVV